MSCYFKGNSGPLRKKPLKLLALPSCFPLSILYPVCISGETVALHLSRTSPVSSQSDPCLIPQGPTSVTFRFLHRGVPSWFPGCLPFVCLFVLSMKPSSTDLSVIYSVLGITDPLVLVFPATTGSDLESAFLKFSSPLTQLPLLFLELLFCFLLGSPLLPVS